MRRVLTFACEGSTLHATLDHAAGATGLLIVSGGNEIRVGAHRGMAKLAGDIAAAGYPAFRFDRRGIGDSEGENGGFRSAGPDIEAAVSCFSDECPQLSRIVAFGNCDAATALVLNHAREFDLVLANPWIFEPVNNLPPSAAIKARYKERLRDPKALLGLFTGAINLRKLAAGVTHLLARPKTQQTLATDFWTALSIQMSLPPRATILLAVRDATAIAFAAEWNSELFAEFRNHDCNHIPIIEIDSASHSFASERDYSALKAIILEALAQ